MPDGALEGTLKESDGSDNSASALEADDTGVDIENIFDTKSDNDNSKSTPESSAKVKTGVSTNDDGAIKIKRDAKVQVEESEVDDTGDDSTKPAKEASTQDGEEGEVVEGEDDKITGETPADKAARLKRDYTGFKPEDAEVLKKLPNAIFNHVAPAVKARYKVEQQLATLNNELAEIKKNPNRIPDNWYENPRAIEITPEYQALSDKYAQVDYEVQHWNQQLLNIKAGKPYTGLDYRDGQYRETGPFEASHEVEIQVQNHLFKLQNHGQQLITQAEQLQKEFKTQFEQANKFYDLPEVNKYFDQLLPELKPINEHIEAYIEGLPKQHKNHPLAKFSGKMFSVIVNQATLIKKLREAKNTAKLNADDNKTAGPKTKKTTVAVGGKAGSVGKEIDFDDIVSELRSED